MVKLIDAHTDLQMLTQHDCCRECGRILERATAHGITLTVEKLIVGDQSVNLPYRIFQILSVLLKHFGQTVHRENIYNAVWGDTDVDVKSIDVYQIKINRLLAPLGLKIRNTWGVGKALVWIDEDRNNSPVPDVANHAADLRAVAV